MQTLLARFLATAAQVPDAPALSIGEREWSYAQLAADAARVAAVLQAVDDPTSAGTTTAVFGNRSHAAYSALLGSLALGRGYVPLNPGFPPNVVRQMLELSGAARILVAPEALPILEAALEGIARPLALILPAEAAHEAAALAERYPQHRVLRLDDAATPAPLQAPAAARDDLTVIMFTSGSTGVPKGVALSEGNFAHFFEVLHERSRCGPGDRNSQVVPLNFDMSIFDLFYAWSNGACVCAPTQEQTMALGRFITEQRLTVWFSTPALMALVRRQGDLQPAQHTGLRQLFFAGEALPLDLARELHAAAPNAVIWNIYGPAELTLTCTWYRYQREHAEACGEVGFVPIGESHRGHVELIVDEELREVAPGEIGEYLLAGPQVALGYWNDPERTARAFVQLPGRPERFYRSGDLVRRPREPGWPMTFLGRSDLQTKIQGVRFELAEVEKHIREVTGCDAVAVGWPPAGGGFEALVVFLVGPPVNWPEVRKELLQRLPPLAVPRRAIMLDAFPTTSSGKTDRKALRERLG